MINRVSENRIVRINRGDSIRIPFYAKLTPENNVTQKLYFALMEPNQAFEDALIKRSYDENSAVDEDDNIIIQLTPQDTEYVREGTYYYCIKYQKITTNNAEYVETVLPKTLFYII